MREIIYLILFLALIVTTPAFADYKIILKNGREFIVDDYKDVDGKVKFFKGGGEIEIDKNNVEDIKKVTVTKKAEEAIPSETMKKDLPVEPVDKGGDTRSKRQEIENRLKEIAKKKEEMKAEKDKLDAESKKLDDDIKKEGNLMLIRKKREFERRIPEITEKIKKFNEELNKLNEEEDKLAKELKETGPQQKQQ